jgi:hypothetical protein
MTKMALGIRLVKCTVYLSQMADSRINVIMDDELFVVLNFVGYIGLTEIALYILYSILYILFSDKSHKTIHDSSVNVFFTYT